MDSHFTAQYAVTHEAAFQNRSLLCPTLSVKMKNLCLKPCTAQIIRQAYAMEV